MGDSDVVSDSGRSEEEIDLFEGVSREETDAPLLFGWARGRTSSRAEGRWVAKTFSTVGCRSVWARAPPRRRPSTVCVQRAAPPTGAHHLGAAFSMDVVNTVGALRCGEHEVGISVEYAPPPALFSRSSPSRRVSSYATASAAACRSPTARPSPPRRRARSRRAPRSPSAAVAAVGGEDARARVGCERLGALLVVRRRRLRRRRGRRRARTSTRASATACRSTR